MSQIRTHARRCAVQALYAWQMTGLNLDAIEHQFHEKWDLGKSDLNFFRELLYRVPEELEVIDEALAEFVDRAIDVIGPVERAILRMGVYELFNRPDVPYKVVINESINLAKMFGASESHKYINGVLDKIAHKQRALEVKPE